MGSNPSTCKNNVVENEDVEDNTKSKISRRKSIGMALRKSISNLTPAMINLNMEGLPTTEELVDMKESWASLKMEGKKNALRAAFSHIFFDQPDFLNIFHITLEGSSTSSKPDPMRILERLELETKFDSHLVKIAQFIQNVLECVIGGNMQLLRLLTVHCGTFHKSSLGVSVVKPEYWSDFKRHLVKFIILGIKEDSPSADDDVDWEKMGRAWDALLTVTVRSIQEGYTVTSNHTTSIGPNKFYQMASADTGHRGLFLTN